MRETPLETHKSDNESNAFSVSSNIQEFIDEPLVGIIKKNQPDTVEVYLINASNSNFTFVLYKRNSNKFSLVYQDVLPACTAHRIANFNVSEIDNFRFFTIQILRFYSETIKLPEVTNFKINIKDRCLIQQNDDLPILGLKGNLITYLSTEILKEEKQDHLQKSKTIPTVFDIHSQELLSEEEESKMTAHQILTLQLNEVKKILNNAFRNKVSEITIIHGVGNGRLKEEVIKILDKEPLIASYQDAEQKHFGFGATIIMFHKY